MNDQPPDAPHAPAPETPAPEAATTPSPPDRTTRIIAVANQKGGVGKTTTVVNLAACLAELGQRVLVLDLDPQANATSGLGLGRQTGASLYGPLLGSGDAAATIQPSAIPGLDVIPSELDLAGVEIEIARSENYLTRLQLTLNPIRDSARYDFIIIDCPPSLGILTMNALATADAILAPIQCEYYALEGLSVIHSLIAKLRDGGVNPRLRLEGIVMTMYDARTNLGGEVVREVNKHFAEYLYDTVIPRNVRLSEAPSFGKPITLHDPLSPGTAAYRRLAEEFLKRLGLTRAPGTHVPKRPRRLPIFRITTISKQ